MKIKITVLGILLIALAVLVIYQPKPADPQKGKELFKSGASLFEQGKLDEAIKAYEDGVKADPTSSEGYNYLGMAYRYKAQTTKNKSFKKKEIRSFKKSISNDPKNWYPQINLGSTLFHSGQKRKAVPYLKKGLELNPHNLEASKILEMIEEGEKE